MHKELLTLVEKKTRPLTSIGNASEEIALMLAIFDFKRKRSIPLITAYKHQQATNSDDKAYYGQVVKIIKRRWTNRQRTREDIIVRFIVQS